MISGNGSRGCSQDGQFIFVLLGWEGSAADSRVLRDAISRPDGLKVPKGYYYLGDAGYMNGEGFLTPYRGQRYHLSEWRHGAQPRTAQEFFNMKHSSARNVIERCFGMLKGRWAIVRSKSFYPVKTQCKIISACCLLHNHIRREMAVDPLDGEEVDMQHVDDNMGALDLITHVESSNAWTLRRDQMAHDMFNTWRNHVQSTNTDIMTDESQSFRNKRNHTWTAEEDKILVECMTEIAHLWRGENGFKQGFSNAIERMMHLKIPDCSLKAIPHITSRVKLLKKQYNAIYEMTGGSGGSGFGWNDSKKMIDVEKGIFDDWVKSHPTAKGLYNKPFPHYDILGTIFGKDAATGGNAETMGQSVNVLEANAACNAESVNVSDEYLDLTGDYIPTPLPDPVIPEVPIEEIVPPSDVSTATAKKGKKRDRPEDPLVAPIVDVMKDINQNYRDGIDKLVSCFQHQANGSKRRMSIMEELEKVGDLTDSQMVKLAVQLGKDTTLTDVFMQCNDQQRKCLLADLLSDKLFILMKLVPDGRNWVLLSDIGVNPPFSSLALMICGADTVAVNVVAG
ncbi:uncharacterized protein LOC133314647 [Gastrolobium bilobum]|uniref:uncharacterized protein LOC133314647 n=1 Tax=Gastrolobium bilobum TaxID=150636 RepID=UPI002AB1E90E|nr:uncharacterized protein LOC133314647 [Gastrolobium bilobum]